GALRCRDHLDRLALVAHKANGESRKPVRIRRGPATVTGISHGSTPLGVFTREGEPTARSQETSPFAPPVDPSREGWWRCAPRAGANPSPLPSGVGFLLCAAGHIAPTSPACCGWPPLRRVAARSGQRRRTVSPSRTTRAGG